MHRYFLSGVLTVVIILFIGLSINAAVPKIPVWVLLIAVGIVFSIMRPQYYAILDPKAHKSSSLSSPPPSY